MTLFYAVFPEQKISDKTSQNKDLSQHCFVQWQRELNKQHRLFHCVRSAYVIARSCLIRGPQKILCTFGEKEHTSKRVGIIACNNVISKVQCATHRRELTPYERMHCILHIMRIPFREILTSLRSSEWHKTFAKHNDTIRHVRYQTLK